MIFGAAASARRRSRLLLGALLLLMSGCSLGVPSSQVSAPAFEGPPKIQIALPLADQTFLAGSTVIVQARIENAGPDLVRISILLDGSVLGEQHYPNTGGAAIVPLTMDWPTSNAGQFEIAVEAERADGNSAREIVHISVIREPTADHTPEPVEQVDAPVSDDQQQQPDQVAPENTPIPAPTSASEPAPLTTDIPPPVTSVTVRAVITKPSNLRFGPGTSFDLVGSIAVEEEVEIVAVNAGRDWYRIRYSDLGDAWIYFELLDPQGDVSALAVDAGPAPPQPLGVAADENWVNLVIQDIIVEPFPLICNQPGTLSVTVRNQGNTGTSTGGFVEFQIVHKRTGESSGGTITPRVFRQVPAGEFVTTAKVDVTVNVFSDETHRVTASIIFDDLISETNVDDNTFSKEFELQRGECP